MKTFSIIIATFNAGRTLSRCIESITKQKKDDMELIIIDGGSKDNTNAIISKWSDCIDYTISEKDQGLYDAWNKGVAVARGKWILFIGADDYYASYAFEEYRRFLQANDAENIDLISGKCEYVNSSGEVLKYFGQPYKWSVFRHYMSISHGSTLHNRKLFEHLGLFSLNYKICADYDFLLRKKMNAKYIDKVLLVMEDGGMSNSINAIFETYSIKRTHKCNSFISDFWYLIKGIISIYRRKL